MEIKSVVVTVINLKFKSQVAVTQRKRGCVSESSNPLPALARRRLSGSLVPRAMPR